MYEFHLAQFIQIKFKKTRKWKVPSAENFWIYRVSQSLWLCYRKDRLIHIHQIFIQWNNAIEISSSDDDWKWSQMKSERLAFILKAARDDMVCDGFTAWFTVVEKGKNDTIVQATAFLLLWWHVRKIHSGSTAIISSLAATIRILHLLLCRNFCIKSEKYFLLLFVMLNRSTVVQ